MHLDQQTQQNAVVALQSHEVAVITDSIAKISCKKCKWKRVYEVKTPFLKELKS